ncbi:FAD binding domain-containing protein [Actinoplanes sp. G11-F43]|uniref:FAD binding domain-containing protein n=1 Tax=Actinoplanes sp. G11-F43 TaxID=3424130 RepID=UPI003D33C75B
MDLNTVTAVISPAAPGDWRPGDAWLGGGTALFGEPRPEITRLLDLTAAGWPPLTFHGDHVEVAATCTIAQLAAGLGERFPIVLECCHAFLASFKIWNVATVGGNLCASLPAGPMISLSVAMAGTCVVAGPDGSSREVPAADFVTGEGRNVLSDGELLRAVRLPMATLSARTAYRRGSLFRHGRSAVLLIGRVEPDGELSLTVTAATKKPYVVKNVDGLDDWVDDVHGSPAWRRHLTHRYAAQIRAELMS